MFNRTALLAATAAVTLAAGSAMAQSSSSYSSSAAPCHDTVSATSVSDRTGATDSLGVRNDTTKDDNQLKQPAVWKGQRAQNEKVNVGNALPQRTAFGNVGDIDNSATGTLNHLPSGALIVDRPAVIASDRIEPTPAPVVEQRTVVAQPAADTTTYNNGIDNRFLKPADPAVVTPDYKMNAGVDRTLAQDKNVYGRNYRMDEYRVNDQTAMRDISNHPIDSLNDPRFKGPAIPDDALTQAQPASERMTPDTTSKDVYVAPAARPVVTPATPVRPDEYQSTWSSESDRAANDDNAVRPYRYPDKDQPAPMKGERALNALDNTRNPVPDKTIFGKTGDIHSDGPVNNAGNSSYNP